MRAAFFAIALLAIGHVRAQCRFGTWTGAGFAWMWDHVESQGFAEHTLRMPAVPVSLSLTVPDRGRCTFDLRAGYQFRTTSSRMYAGGNGGRSSRDGSYAMHLLTMDPGVRFSLGAQGTWAIRLSTEMRWSATMLFTGRYMEYRLDLEGASYVNSEVEHRPVERGWELMHRLGFQRTVAAARGIRFIGEVYAGTAPYSRLLEGPRTHWVEGGLCIGLLLFGSQMNGTKP